MAEDPSFDELMARLRADDDEAEAGAVLSREPTPTEAARLAESVEALLRPLEGCERQILELRLQGCPVSEISAAVGRTERTVHRLLERARKRLERLDGEGAGGA